MSCNRNNHSQNCSNYNEYDEEQTHTHEFLGSTKLAEECDDRHNHRFAGVTGEAICECNSHIHKIKIRTDFLDHFHKICVCTGPAIPVGNGKHIHLICAVTTCVDGHEHNVIATTLIDSPLV